MLDILNIFLLVSIIKIAFNRAAECVKVAYFLSYIKLQGYHLSCSETLVSVAASCDENSVFPW